MDKVKLVAGALAGVLLVGCNNNSKFATELKAVDSLQAVVENYEMRMDSVDSETMAERAKEVDRQYKFLENNFKDTTARDFWVNKMTYYRLVMKGYTKFPKGEEKLNEDIATSKMQLASLENSLKDEKLTPEEAEQYLSDEAMAVKEIEMHYQKLVPGMQNVEELYNVFKPQMDSVEQHLVNQK